MVFFLSTSTLDSLFFLVSTNFTCRQRVGPLAIPFQFQTWQRFNACPHTPGAIRSVLYIPGTRVYDRGINRAFPLQVFLSEGDP